MAEELVLGRQRIAWGGEVCLGEDDQWASRRASQDSVWARYAVRYIETNTNRAEAAGEVRGGFRNAIFWDGVLVATSEARPELALGEERG